MSTEDKINLPAIMIKYNYELDNAQQCRDNLKSAALSASRWSVFWIIISWTIDGLLSLCVLISSINRQTEVINQEVMEVIEIISLILKGFEMLFQAKNRSTIAGVIRDNYNKAAKLIEDKIIDLKMIAEGGITKNELNTWSHIKDYIDNIMKLSEKWPNGWLIDNNNKKIESIQQQISSKLINDSKTIELQMETIITS